MNDPQSCELCFQPVGPFYRVLILPATPLDFCGGTATPPHARIPGEQKIACHPCRYTFTNLEPDLTPALEPCNIEEPPDTFINLEVNLVPALEPCNIEEPPDASDNLVVNLKSNLEPCIIEEPAYLSEDESPAPSPGAPTPTPTLILTSSTAHPSRSSMRPIANNHASTSHNSSGELASQRAPPRDFDPPQIYYSRAPP
jgi:hypothetical protein